MSQVSTNKAFNFRTGFGIDIHQLKHGRKLIIGGIHIPSSFGALGHSDADVLVHAICDALLGAANLRDIGYHFPDTDPSFKDIDSLTLLAKCIKLVRGKNYEISNLDCTVLLEAPKLSGFIPAMQVRISEVLQIDIDQVSIKATRGEKIGFVGRSEGIKAYCSILIYKS